MDTLYTFWDNITHYKTNSVDFLGLVNSATKVLRWVKVLCLPLKSIHVLGLMNSATKLPVTVLLRLSGLRWVFRV